MEKKLNNNEIINTTSLACLSGNSINSKGDIEYEEFNCNRLFIIATTSPTSTSVSNMSEQGLPYSDMYIYKVNNALSNGINGDLVSCGLLNLVSGQIRIDSSTGETIRIPCGAIS